jgi:hypothetical protein
MRYAYRQWHVAVFSGDRAADLLVVFAVVANNPGDAIQQAWEYVRAQWQTNPRALEYVPLPLPVIRERRRREGARDGQA